MEIERMEKVDMIAELLAGSKVLHLLAENEYDDDGLSILCEHIADAMERASSFLESSTR